jgi:hypothetical protein
MPAGAPARGEGATANSESARQELSVRVDGLDNALVAQTFSILRDRIECRCATRVVAGKSDARIVLTVQPSLPSDAFLIDEAGGNMRIAGGSPRGLLYGVGKFLRTSKYNGQFLPSSWRGTSQPRGTLRGMYFASHFHNWYHQASQAEITRYTADIALWGVNAIKLSFPTINIKDWQDPEADAAIAMLRKYAKTAHELGLQFATGMNNTWFINAPQNIRAIRLPDPTGRRGNSGHPICPSKPDGLAYILENAQTFFKKMAGAEIDILMFWPYDEGGCACQQCQPWGCNGFLKLSRQLAHLGRSYFPKMKTVLSTWMFDTPPEGEWQGLSDALAKEGGWVDYVLADSHEDYPRYPLDVGVPGSLPLLNFPEISMWGNWPWGGFGANPLPRRFQRLWDQVRQKVSGGFPYSEGIYEDINKAIVAQFYWDPDRTARETLTEYIAYEFGTSDAADILALIDNVETNAALSYRKQPVDIEAAQRAYWLAERVDSRLPAWAKHNWRWELLRLRAVLDRERFIGGSLETPAAEAALLRLIEIYHCQFETDDPYHHRVRPPLRKAVSRRGKA